MNNASRSMAGLCCMIFGGLFASQAIALAQNWQYFQNPVAMPKYVTSVSIDAGGNLWYASESQIGKFDGFQWETHNFQAAGINIWFNYLKSMAHAPDGKIWCGGQDRVLEFDPSNGTWTLHDPSNNGLNVNGFDISLDNTGKVWWSAQGWYEWEGAQWHENFFYFPYPEGQEISAGSIRRIIHDQNNDQWMISSGTLGLDLGGITPAGVIHKTATDTVLYKMGDMGFPTAMTLLATPNTQGYPLFALFKHTTAGQRQKPHLFSFEFGSWQDLGEAPFLMLNGAEIFQDAVGNIWLAGKSSAYQTAVLRRFPNGIWEQYSLDYQQITEIFDITGAPDGSIWVGGRNTDNGNQGVLARLPVQPVTGTLGLASICPKIALMQNGDLLELQNLPSGEQQPILIFDVQGRQMASLVLTGPSIPIGDWPLGVYILNIGGNDICPAQALKFVKH